MQQVVTEVEGKWINSEVRVASWNPGLNPQIPDRPLLPWRYKAIGALAIVAFMAAASHFIGDYGPFVFLAVLFVWAIYSGARLVLRRRQLRKTALLAVPWEEPGDSMLRFWVELDVVRGNVITGSDTGYLWKEQGALCFAGSSTSFALTSDLIDTWYLNDKPGCTKPFGRRIEVRMARFRELHDWALHIDIVKEQSPETEDRFQRMMRTVMDTRGPSTLRQHPPVDRGPGAFTKGELQQIALLSFSQWFFGGILPMAAIFVWICISPMQWRVALYLGIFGRNLSMSRLNLALKASRELARATG